MHIVYDINLSLTNELKVYIGISLVNIGAHNILYCSWWLDIILWVCVQTAVSILSCNMICQINIRLIAN